jgi:CRISPR-associated protein Cas1
MLKRTLFFGNPAYLSTRQQQMVIDRPGLEGPDAQRTVPIEDVGFVVLEHQQITLSNALMGRLMENNVVLIHCNESHLPTGMTLALNGHTEQGARVQAQLKASEPLKKQLWQQLMVRKIGNQAVHLFTVGELDAARKLERYTQEVKSGDAGNLEATAAAHYWKHFLPNHFGFFRRSTEEDRVNVRLNYGYAILRAAMARAITGTGLLPVLGIFHRNKYNAYALADDLMEPFRPWTDALVRAMVVTGYQEEEALNPSIKQQLVGILTHDVALEGQQVPLMHAIQRTAVSLAQCYLGERRKLTLPEMHASGTV